MIVPLLAAIAPFFLWPIEYFIPFPVILEELAKAGLVLFIIRSGSKNPVRDGIIAGLLFAFSETVLYFVNILPTGMGSTILIRIATTTPLHIITLLIILIPSLKNLKLMPLGIAMAAALHFLFNFYITDFV